MDNISNDYIAMKLAEAKLEDIRRESEMSRLANIALEQVKQVVIRLPKIRFNQN